jgi:hypothetical protein
LCQYREQDDEAVTSTVKIRCIVASGRGKSARNQRFIETVSRVCGVRMFPGSLNLLARQPVRLGSNPPSLQEPTILKSILVPARLMGEPVFIRRWRASPLHSFEIYSPNKLRQALRLCDGDDVTLEIPRACVVEIPLRDRFFWALFWRFRERLLYSSDLYLKVVRKLLNGRRLGTQYYTCERTEEES